MAVSAQNPRGMASPSYTNPNPPPAGLPPPYADFRPGPNGERTRQNSRSSDARAMSIAGESDPGRDHIGVESAPLHHAYGRTYQGFRKWAYFLPCDDREQDRLDLFHRVITEARHGEGLLYSAHPPNGRIMDLGCGTGIWALDIANKNPQAHVVGIDLAPIQPHNGPPNCDFYSSFDYESLWEMGQNTWDIIHMQMASGSVVSWPSLYRRIFSHLRPGAVFEQVEIDFEPRCDDDNLKDTAISAWYQYLKEATQRTMRPLAHNWRDTVNALEGVGFELLDHQVVGLPLNPWLLDERERTVARWYNLAFLESVYPFTLAPFTRVYGSSLDYIEKTAELVKRDANNSDLHVYNLMHIYRARKPTQ